MLYYNIQLATLFSKTVPLFQLICCGSFQVQKLVTHRQANKIFLIRTKIKETKELDKEFIDKTRLLQIAKLQ